MYSIMKIPFEVGELAHKPLSAKVWLFQAVAKEKELPWNVQKRDFASKGNSISLQKAAFANVFRPRHIKPAKRHY